MSTKDRAGNAGVYLAAHLSCRHRGCEEASLATTVTWQVLTVGLQAGIWATREGPAAIRRIRLPVLS